MPFAEIRAHFLGRQLSTLFDIRFRFARYGIKG